MHLLHKLRVKDGEFTFGACRKLVANHVSTCDYAVGYRNLTAGTCQSILQEHEITIWTWCASLLDLCFVRMSNECLYFLLVLAVNLVPVLRSQEHGCVVEGGVVQATTLTLDDS